MLLLVVEAKLEPPTRITVERAVQECMRYPGIDRCAIRVDPVQARPREHAAPRSLDPRADRFVVAVEQERVRRIERLAAQHERLEEPRGVREVPLRRARVRHRLDDVVLGRQRRT